MIKGRLARGAGETGAGEVALLDGVAKAAARDAEVYPAKGPAPTSVHTVRVPSAVG